MKYADYFNIDRNLMRNDSSPLSVTEWAALRNGLRYYLACLIDAIPADAGFQEFQFKERK